jgi:hypothetical protein
VLTHRALVRSHGAGAVDARQVFAALPVQVEGGAKLLCFSADLVLHQLDLLIRRTKHDINCWINYICLFWLCTLDAGYYIGLVAV